jgi:hypothetical protein
MRRAPSLSSSRAVGNCQRNGRRHFRPRGQPVGACAENPSSCRTSVAESREAARTLYNSAAWLGRTAQSGKGAARIGAPMTRDEAPKHVRLQILVTL